MFGGTGTVAAVARSLGRHYIHIDASLAYCEQALARVQETVPPAGWENIAVPDTVTVLPPPV
jgi:DNA modification methylase